MALSRARGPKTVVRFWRIVNWFIIPMFAAVVTQFLGFFLVQSKQIVELAATKAGLAVHSGPLLFISDNLAEFY